MENALQIAIGFLFTLVTGFAVAPFLKKLRRHIDVPAVSADPESEAAWRKLRELPKLSGTWIGIFERLIFFSALVIGSWETIGIWIAFKAAARWKARNHVGHIPGTVNGVDPPQWDCARRVWATQEYMTFIVGTAANLLLASTGAAIARL